MTIFCLCLLQSGPLNIPRVYFYLNVCWAPHLETGPKHFTMATTAQLSASMQTHCTLAEYNSEVVTVQSGCYKGLNVMILLNVSFAGSAISLPRTPWSKIQSLCFAVEMFSIFAITSAAILLIWNYTFTLHLMRPTVKWNTWNTHAEYMSYNAWFFLLL